MDAFLCHGYDTVDSMCCVLIFPADREMNGSAFLFKLFYIENCYLIDG